MPLQGSLQEIGITSILPMLKTENQTGVLEVKYKDDVIRISFLEGQIVYGETAPSRDIKRLRDTLLANNLVLREDWKQIHDRHADSLDSIWNVLAAKVPMEDVSRLLQRQVTDAVYALLRFKKGAYRFLSSRKVDYPEKYIEPMDVDFLLLEGCRVADEWSVEEKKLPSLDTFLKKSILPEEAPDETTRIANDGRLDFSETIEFEVLEEQGIEITEEENRVLSVVGDQRTIRDLLDMADTSHFEACRAIVSLMEKKILTPVTKQKTSEVFKPIVKQGAMAGYLLIAVLLLVVALSVVRRVQTLPTQITAAKALLNTLYAERTAQRMDDTLYLLDLHRRETGAMATDLAQLAGSGLADEEDLQDAWGRPLQYKRAKHSFVLYSLGPDDLLNGDEIFASLE